MPVREKGAGSQWSRKKAKGQAWLCNPVALRSSLQEAWGQKKKMWPPSRRCICQRAKQVQQFAHLQLLNIQTENVAAIREKKSLSSPFNKLTTQDIPLTNKRQVSQRQVSLLEHGLAC